MFLRKAKTELDTQIERVLSALSKPDQTTDEYATIMVMLERLYKLREQERSLGIRVSPETIALILGNLAGILLVLHYEQARIVTSKAFGFITRLR